MSHYILIHGSWHGAWCWHKVADRLVANGHTVDVPDLPCHGKNWGAHKEVTLSSYVTTITDIIDKTDQPVTLVAHSRGGIVGSSVAEARPDKVMRTVYVAAYLVADGKTVADYAIQDSDSLVLPNMDQNPEEGWDMLQSHAFHDALYADCDDDDIALCHLLLTPEPAAPTYTPLSLSEKNYGRVPRSYIMLTQDNAVSPKLQRLMLQETPCEIMELEASHSAYFSKPAALTKAIEETNER
ncbi:MAG: alpha/beta fold hydrolase [Rhodobiaceae bacterium]|nr:alpha/beta fold hydrolase [Rhodobiaceae bacterium]